MNSSDVLKLIEEERQIAERNQQLLDNSLKPREPGEGHSSIGLPNFRSRQDHIPEEKSLYTYIKNFNPSVLGGRFDKYTDQEKILETIDAFIEFWRAPEAPREYREWVYKRFRIIDMDAEINSDDLFIVFTERKQELQSLHMIACQQNMVGTDRQDKYEVQKKFAILFECIVFYHASIEGEIRGRQMAINTQRQESDVRTGIFYGSTINFDLLDNHQQLLLYLLLQLHREGMKRYRKMCYKEILYDGLRTHAWEEKCEIKQFIYQSTPKEIHFTQWLNLTKKGRGTKALEEYLLYCTDAEFQDLVPDRHTWSFQNALYKGAEKKWYVYSDEDISLDIVSCKYFDMEVPQEVLDGKYVHWKDYPTPKFDKILNDQHLPDDVKDWMYVFLGRLFYNVKEKDGWEVMPFLKGVAGSGKSTIAKVIKRCYNDADVGILSANMEKTFGLSSFADKLLFLCYEVKRNMNLKQSDFQCMTSGEEVVVNTKYETARVKSWTVPGILCGNEVTNWVDTSGSILRRIVLFEFLYDIKDTNPKFLEELEKEFPYLIPKLNLAYLEYAEKYGNDTVWKHLGKYFQDTRKHLEVLVNPLTAFLTTGKNVKVQADLYMPHRDFRKMYEEWSKGRMKKQDYNEDFYNPVFQSLKISLHNERREYNKAFVETEFLHGVGVIEYPHVLQSNTQKEEKEEMNAQQRILE